MLFSLQHHTQFAEELLQRSLSLALYSFIESVSELEEVVPVIHEI